MFLPNVSLSILSSLYYDMSSNCLVKTSVGQIMNDVQKDRKTISKHLAILQNNNFIESEAILLTSKKNEPLKIQVKDTTSKGFHLIDESVFRENYKNISDTGWAILCLLVVENNKKGLCPKTIINKLEIVDVTLEKYILKLEESNLITVDKGNHFIGYNEHGEEVWGESSGCIRLNF